MNLASAKSLTWICLSDMFRIRRSSLIMPKPLMRSHCKAMCFTKLASCFGRVTVVGDIHVSITRNVADPQSCGNHWCEAIAKPCVCAPGQRSDLAIQKRFAACSDTNDCDKLKWVNWIRNVADSQSCGNHWWEAIAKPCAIENWPIVLAEWQPLETFM